MLRPVSEVARPLPSSTVILLRDEPRGDAPFSVLMLERHGSITFPGVHAFPGGVVDPGDEHAPGAALPATQRWAAANEGDSAATALPYWVAAARELFEEVGILMAAGGRGLVAGPLTPALLALRARSERGAPFAALLAEHGLVPATDRLFYFSRWITPPANPRRFDTRFLVGRVPLGQEPSADGTETVDCAWYSPRAALAAFEDARIQLIPPTVRTLDDLARFPSVDAVLADASRRRVRAVRAELITEGEASVLDDGAVPLRRLELRDGRWRPAS